METKQIHIPVACNLNAMTSEQRLRHRAVIEQLRSAVEETTELPDGYSFRYPTDPALFLVAAEFITLESRCCSFFHFSLEKEPDDGPIWLSVTGPGGAKEIIGGVFSG